MGASYTNYSITTLFIFPEKSGLPLLLLVVILVALHCDVDTPSNIPVRMQCIGGNAYEGLVDRTTGGFDGYNRSKSAFVS